MHELLHICCRDARIIWVSYAKYFESPGRIAMLTLCSRNPNAATDSLTPYLLFEGGEDMGICPDFLTELVGRFEEDETVKPMITKAVSGISLQLSNMTMNDNSKPLVNVGTDHHLAA